MFQSTYFCERMPEIVEKVRLPKVKAGSLPVMESFYTIQGEGANTGLACYFIRLGGCDVGCHWCDVKESWDESRHPHVSIKKLLDLVKSSPATAVVVTGGEPCMYDLTELTASLKDAGLQTFLETSGSYEITGDWDWICVSPKKFIAPLKSSLKKADELKTIIFNKSDFQWAENNASDVKPDCRLYLQPEWDKREQMTKLIVEYVKENPRWRISLQTHKYIDIP